MRLRALDLLPNPDEAVVVVVGAGPKPKAVDAVVLAPNEPNENPGVSSQEHRECCEGSGVRTEQRRQISRAEKARF